MKKDNREPKTPVGSTGLVAGDCDHDPAYQTWLENLAKECLCRSGEVPCCGLMAGGMCDELTDDEWDDE